MRSQIATSWKDCEEDMKDSELIGKVHNAVYQQCKNRGYAAAVDVLVDVGVLTKAKAEEWRFGKIPYLEAACSCNLRQLNLILKEMRVYSEKSGYKPSFCYYKRWGTKKKNGQGKKPVIPLRFSKSGNASLEKTYATHYVKKVFFSKKEDKNFCEEKETFTD